MRDIVAWVDGRLERGGVWTVLGVFCAIYVIKAGVWYYPATSSSLLLASNPFSSPFVGTEAEYGFENWLAPFLAWTLGATAWWPFVLLHAIFSVTFILLMTMIIWQTVPALDRNKAICVFAMIPVFWVSFYWIGYDSGTLALMALALLALRKPWWVFAVGVLLGMQHWQQGVCGFGALAAVTVDKARSSETLGRWMRGATAVVGGCIVGHFIISTLAWYNGISIHNDRFVWIYNHRHNLYEINIGSLPNFLYGIFSFGWVIVLWYFAKGSNVGRVAGALFLCTLITAISSDTTRVFGLISFPSVAALVLLDARWHTATRLRQVATVCAFWAVTPWVFRWGAIDHHSIVAFDAASTMNKLIGWPDLPPDVGSTRSWWPFR